MIPQTRTDLFLAKITGEDVALPVPQTRFELYLANIAGESYGLPAPNSRATLYLAKILGQDVVLPVPQTRSELYLASIAGMSVELPDEPTTREEWYLARWADEASQVTISGNPVTFSAVAAPLVQLLAAFAPVQDLHGYANPWPAGGGKNKFNVDRTQGTPDPTSSAGSTKPRVMDTSHYFVGLTRDNYYVPSSVNSASVSDGTVSISSKSSGYGIGFPVAVAENTQYTFSATFDNAYVGFGYYDAEWNILSYSGQYSAAATITTPASCAYLVAVIFTYSGTSGSLSNIQLEAGATATSWAPYENVCPISGWTGLNIYQRGKNLFDPDDTFTLPGYGTFIAGKVKEGQTYTVRWANASAGSAYAQRWYKNGAWVSVGYSIPGTSLKSGYTFTVPSGEGIEKYSINGYQDGTGQMLVLGSSAGDYVPYDPDSRAVAIAFGDTYYSGYVNVLTGDGALSWAKAVLNGNHYLHTWFNVDRANNSWGLYINGYEWTRQDADYLGPAPDPSLASGMMSNVLQWGGVYNNENIWHGSFTFFDAAFNYFAFRIPKSTIGGSPTTAAELETLAKAYLAENPIEVCYPLAEPIPFHVDPQAVSSLAGANTMWSDANGDLTVTYRKDGNVSDAEALGILLGGRYTPAQDPDDVPDSEALRIISGR